MSEGWAVLAVIAEDTVPPGSEGEMWSMAADVGGYFMIAVVLVVLAAIVWRLWQASSELGSDSVEAESAFEREIMSQAAGKQGTGGPVGLAGGGSYSLGVPVRAAAVSGEPSGSETGPHHGGAPPAAAGGVDEVVRRLEGLGVTTGLQGRVSLSGTGEGEIHGLRRGGVCVVLPRLETAEALAHFTRRFDVVFCAGADGEVLVVERLQNRVPQLVEFGP